LDQVTKRIAEAELELGVRVDVLGDVLGLRLFYNSGAAFGLGAGITPVLTGFACVAVVALVVGLTRTDSRRWALALAALLGGATGNLIDRLTRSPGPFRGEVVDFLELPSWPIFNIADMAIVTGALSIVLLSLRNIEFAGAPAAAEAVGPPEPDGDLPLDRSPRDA